MLTGQQLLAIAIFGLTLAAFAWDRVRYDVVAVGSLLACVVVGLVESEQAFSGFGNPAVVTVAAVLVLSHALARSGVVNLLGDAVVRIARSPLQHVALLCAIGALISAFINNVGALAIMMPIALALARKFAYSPSLLLMPLSFATMLGGMCTLIGTPPNLLAAGFRERYADAPFGFFDFTPTGALVTFVGIAFLAFAGRFLLPQDRKSQESAIDLFDVGQYVTEVRIPDSSPLADKSVQSIEALLEDKLVVVALMRGGLRGRGRLAQTILAPGDTLIVQAEAELLQQLARKGDVELVAAHTSTGEKPDTPATVVVDTAEVVVPPNAWVQGQTARRLQLRNRFNVNLLAISRKGRPSQERLRDTPIFAGDVLLLEGDVEALAQATRDLGCLPLANRRIALEPFQILVPVIVFGAAIAAVAMNLLPAAIAFALAVLAVVVLRVVPLRELYEAIDWPVIVLLGAMIPVGGVLESTGLAAILAGHMAGLGQFLPGWAMLTVALVATMLVTPMLNNAATVIVMAPIMIGVAQQLGVNPDAFLMAVAIGASCDFLTPFGHQNNTLILAPGGYRFSDYWKLGLPLDLVVVVTSVAALLVIWPLG